MKVLETTVNWDAKFNIQMTLKEFKLFRDCLLSVPYARLEKLEGNQEMPYSYDEMQEVADQTEKILGKLICK